MTRRIMRSIVPKARFVAPNAVTFVVMGSGLCAIRFAGDGAYASAVIALAVAGVADRLDGAVARLLHAASRFGAEFDSFADIVSFGVAPALVIYDWGLRSLGLRGFLPSVIFVTCAALRLARFNLTSEWEPPEYARHFYTGLTSPAGAAIALFPLITALEASTRQLPHVLELAHSATSAAVSLIVAGLLMISPFPLLDFVHVRIPLAAKLTLLISFIVLLVVQPWLGLMVLTPFALLMLAISPAALRRRREAAGK
jgi:CDP-diacylglycerol--serine O-phosphatidyltransferase